MPKEDTILPISIWRRFSDQYRLATGLQVAVFGKDGTPAEGGEFAPGLCPTGQEGRERCSGFYRRAVQQLLQGEEALLFRCPGGFLVFGFPIPNADGVSRGVVAVLGGVALPEDATPAAVAALAQGLGDSRERAVELTSSIPIIPPRRMMELARLAQLCLRTVVQGNALRDSFSHRQAQVLTLFEVASDLYQTSSLLELQALALNTLGVLYDVPSAALLFREPGGETFRAQTAMGSMEKALLNWRASASLHPLDNLAGPSATPHRLDDTLTLRKIGLPEGVDRATLFPLVGRQGLLGFLAILNVEIPTEEEQMIRGFSIQLTLAVENQRLQVEISDRVRELQAVQALSRQFLACLEPESLFQAILDEARKITGAQRGSLMLTTDGNGDLLVKAVTGLNEKVVQKLRVRVGEGVSGRVLESGEPILVQNIEKDPRFSRKNRARYSTKSFVSVPITMDDRTIGVLNLADKLSGEIFAEDDLKIVEAVAVQATIAIERSSYYQQSRELRKISITDPLTGLLNRRYFQERLAEEVDRATRHGHPLSLIMVDIDHFKAYNDANGHPAGDKALVLTGRALRGGIRAIDVVSRYGGEEFAVILPETRKQEAREIGERIRREVETLYFPGEEAVPLKRLTISLGIAGFPEDAHDLKSLIQRADQALYLAKDMGRNRLVLYGEKDDSQAGVAWTKVL